MAVLSLIIGYFGFVPKRAAYSQDSKVRDCSWPYMAFPNIFNREKAIIHYCIWQ
jgi:hypothetical protein